MTNGHSLKQLKQFKSVHLFVLFATLNFVLLSNFANGQITQKYPLGAKLLSKTEYAKLPRANWDILRLNSKRQAIAYATSSVVMLNNPPIGNQGVLQGSCVGWAVGYAATSILAYSKFNDWSTARRSPNYIYNQIKANSDCLSGSFTTTALNLVHTQGDCSWSLMPYVSNDCATIPNNTQRFDAALNNGISWSALVSNDVSGIKQALSLGYPVVIAFSVFQSFYDMWNTGGGIWYMVNSGTYEGDHATCIVGYDDTKQMFKVQNSWGTSGGDNGYFWVTYNLVQNNCLNEAYVLSELNQSVYPTISGPSQICNQGTYNINNLPPGATVTWSSSPIGFLQLVSGQGTSTAVFSKVLNKNNNIISALISLNGNTFTIYKYGIQSGTPQSTFEIYDAATDFQVSRVFVNKNYYFYGVENAIEDDDYTWRITSPSPYQVTTAIDGRQAYYTASTVGHHLVTLQYNGICGWSDIYSEYVYFEPSKKTFLSISPNPASELVNVTVTENLASDNSLLSLNNSNQNTLETDYQGAYEIQLWNENSGLVKTLKSEQSKLQISLKGLPKGMYYVHMIIEGKTTQKKILWIK